jgi:cytochrome c biogenesis protein CcdA/glutaredoxin
MIAVLLLLAAGLVVARPAAAQDDPRPSAPVVVVLFHGEGCPHCAAERTWLVGLLARHSGLRLEEHEVWYDEANRALLQQYAQRLGFEPSGVPVTVVGDRVWIGFSEAIGSQIEAAVTAAEGVPASGVEPSGSADPPEVVDVPVVGPVDVSSSSLVASTLAIGFVDGVNPCSLWVLSVLLAIVLHSGSRRRVLLVGSTFLLVTAGMYALYVVGMYSAMDYASGLPWIRVAVAGVALVFGVLQLADGLAPGRGPSLSIPARRRPDILRRMRPLAAPDRPVAAMLAGTVALAVGVSLLETPCTAGLPMLWTSLLAAQGVSAVQAVVLFVLYMSVFLLDELVVFAAAVVTLRATRVQERHGRLLKLVAGSVLVTLAGTMMVSPDALASPAGAALVFGIAGLLATVLWVVARVEPPPTHRLPRAH